LTKSYVVDGPDRPLAEVLDGEPLDVGQIADRLEDHVHPRRALDIASLPDVVQGVPRRAEDLERVEPAGELPLLVPRRVVERLPDADRVLTEATTVATYGSSSDSCTGG
jgi:hypothetical protein